MYRTFCDESGRGEAAFVVGGLSAKVDRWLAFSDRWQAVLDAEPSLLHFHHSQRQGLTKEQHQAKIEALIPVVNEFVERGDLIVVDVAEYKAVYRNKVGVTYDQPFHIGYVSIFMQAAAHIADPSAKVDFVFDDVDDTALVELREAHREFSAICPAAEVKKRFGALPVTGNDEELPPLQAADLWSGIMRRAYRDRDPLAIRNLERFTIPNRCSLLDQEKITKLWDMLTGHVKKRGLDEIPYEDGPARSKRLAQAKKELARLRREGMLRLDSDPPDDPL
ncbi:MAG TPA: DUF3800 domain-containing protein [Rhizomicrobium sp.]|jgi:hypothetical protein|nr:DUF3800 domain-containing protein [Rhizomicrobium sp.]